MTRFTQLSMALACLATATTLHAESDTEEIIVTAKGAQTIDNILHTAHVFNAGEIEAAQVKDVPALLDHVAGISTRDSGGRGSATSVFVRGVANSQIIVLIDGVRVGSASLGSAALNSYPIEAIERIEVLKGPFSGIYGADAAGGVIQLFTKKGGEGLGAIRATVGSDSLREYDAAIHNSTERYSFHLAVHSEQSDGIDRTSIQTDGNDDRDSFDETAFSFGGQLSLGESTLVNLSVLGTDSAVEFDNTFGADPGLVTDTKTLSTALALDTKLADAWAWSTTLGVNEDESVTNGDFPSEFITNRDSIGSEFVWSISAHSALTFGADYYQEEIESSNEFPVTERDNTGAFVQLQAFGKRVGAVASVRYDDNSAYGSETNGSLAVNYDLNDQLRLVGSYGTAFVAPSFNFLYFPFFGNPDLLPEESTSYELSLVGNHAHVSWRLSAYRTEVENLFSFDPLTFLAANVGEATLEGVEAELQTSWAEWNFSVGVDLLSATDELTGVELDDRAEQTLALTASRSFGALDLRFDIKAENGRFDNFGTELPSYGLFDVSAVYKFSDSLELAANLDNVFDKDYTLNLIGQEARYMTEGRQAKLSVRYRF